MQQNTNLDKKGASFLLNVRSWLSSHSKKGSPSRFAKKESGSCKGGNIIVGVRSCKIDVVKLL